MRNKHTQSTCSLSRLQCERTQGWFDLRKTKNSHKCSCKSLIHSWKHHTRRGYLHPHPCLHPEYGFLPRSRHPHLKKRVHDSSWFVASCFRFMGGIVGSRGPSFCRRCFFVACILCLRLSRFRAYIVNTWGLASECSFVKVQGVAALYRRGLLFCRLSFLFSWLKYTRLIQTCKAKLFCIRLHKAGKVPKTLAFFAWKMDREKWDKKMNDILKCAWK